MYNQVRPEELGNNLINCKANEIIYLLRIKEIKENRKNLAMEMSKKIKFL